VIEMMSDLAHKRGRAVVIVTHDSRVLDFADRIVTIEDGSIAMPSEAETVPHGVLSHNLPQAAIGLV
jgi:ABC-type lipoprotein export system ATPase subunit